MLFLSKNVVVVQKVENGYFDLKIEILIGLFQKYFEKFSDQEMDQNDYHDKNKVDSL